MMPSIRLGFLKTTAGCVSSENYLVGSNGIHTMSGEECKSCPDYRAPEKEDTEIPQQGLTLQLRGWKQTQ